MPALDLYRASANPTPQQLLDVCSQFMPIVNAIGKKSWDEVVDTAQHLSEQILGHYQGLEAVSQETQGLGRPGEKLPYQIFYVFLYACVKDHPAMGLIMEELEKLYADGTDRRAIAGMQGLWQGTLLDMIAAPKLWAEDGTLKYSPSAYAQMHLNPLYRQITDHWHKGVPGIQKILDDYPQMNESSRKLMDAELCYMVYKWTETDDHPLRLLLADKLNVGFDGRARFENLLDRLDFASDNEFEQRFEFAFSLIKPLPKFKADWVFKGIDEYITRRMSDDEDHMEFKLDSPERVVPRLVRILETAKAYGYSPLQQIHKDSHVSAPQCDDRDILLVLIKGGFTTNPDDIDMEVAWREAAMIAADEDVLLSLDLNEKDLVQLSRHKGTPGIRAALLKTTTGRDVLFGQDLGL